MNRLSKAVAIALTAIIILAGGASATGGHDKDCRHYDKCGGPTPSAKPTHTPRPTPTVEVTPTPPPEYSPTPRPTPVTSAKPPSPTPTPSLEQPSQPPLRPAPTPPDTGTSETASSGSEVMGWLLTAFAITLLIAIGHRDLKPRSRRRVG